MYAFSLRVIPGPTKAQNSYIHSGEENRMPSQIDTSSFMSKEARIVSKFRVRCAPLALACSMGRVMRAKARS